nr:coat protein [Pistacia sobemo-like virus]
MARRKGQKKTTVVERVVTRQTPRQQAMPNGNSRRRRRRNRSGGQSGAQEVSQPLSSGALLRNLVPRINGYQGPRTVIAHSELVIKVECKKDVEIYELAIIPDLGPWLRGVASCFSKYRWRSFKMVYVPTCPATEKGQFHMGYLYDTSDNAPSSLTEISNLDGYSTGPVWSGSVGALSLKGDRDYSGSIVSKADTARTSLIWYPFTVQSRIEDAMKVDVVLGNSYSPFSIIIGTAGGENPAEGEDPAVVGGLYIVYEVELIEPIAPVLHSGMGLTAAKNAKKHVVNNDRFLDFVEVPVL